MATAIPCAQTASSPGAALVESIPPAQAVLIVVSLPSLHLSCGHTGKVSMQLGLGSFYFCCLSTSVLAGHYQQGNFLSRHHHGSPSTPSIPEELHRWHPVSAQMDTCGRTDNWSWSRNIGSLKKKIFQTATACFWECKYTLKHHWICQESCKEDLKDPGLKNHGGRDRVVLSACSPEAGNKIRRIHKVSSNFSIYPSQPSAGLD